MVRFHRALLIFATVGVAVAASRVAADVSETGGWLLTAAFALLLLVADLAREIEEAAKALSDSSGESRTDARRDLYTTRHPLSISIMLLVVAGLFVAAAVAYSWHGVRPHRSHPLTRPLTTNSAGSQRPAVTTAKR
jgi:hypothetical protein